MTITVRIEDLAPVPFAAVRRQTIFGQVPSVLLAGLDVVWAFIRRNALAHGHNVAVYRKLGGEDVELTCGVIVSDAFAEEGEIFRDETPAGTAATAVHVGPYAGIGATYDAIARQARSQGYRLAGINWEIYGHWQNDPARLETTLHMLIERN